MHGVKNHNNCFLEEWHELQEISSTCVDTNRRGIEATFIVSGDRGTTPHKFAFQVRATKALVVASQQGCNNFVCTCLQTQSTMELSHKLTKSMPRRRLTRAFT